MCAHLVLMTQFYSQCAFETQNLQNYFHLKQSHAPQNNACKLHASDAILSLLCIWNPKSRKLFAFKHIYVPQDNVFTFPASDAILSSVSIKKPLSGKVFSFKNIHTPQGNVSTQDASDAILSSVLIETPYLENYFHLSIFMLLRAMCSRMVLLTQFAPLCAFETSNLEKFFIQAYLCSVGQCVHAWCFWRNLILIVHWNSQSGKVLSFNTYWCSSEQWVYTWCFWRNFILIVHFKPQIRKIIFI